MPAVTDSIRRDYVAALVARDGHRARALIDRAVAEVGDPARIELEVLGPAMHDIGDLWEAGDITVADEHYASGVTEGVLAVLASRMRVAPAGGRMAVVACPPGERHALAARMLADVLEAQGWEALLLGPDMPARALLELVEAEQPDVLAISVTMPDRLDAVAELIGAVDVLEPRPFVAVGGQACAGAEVGADLVTATIGDLVGELLRRFPPLPDD